MSNPGNNNKGGALDQFKRNRYFYGKLMSVRDFEDEQHYMNGKRQLLNRVVNGPGIVYGLGDPVPDVVSNKVVVRFARGGLALDCSGREVVVPPGSERDVYLGESNLTAESTNQGKTFYLYLEYSTRDYELVGSTTNPAGFEEGCEYNRLLEDFKVLAMEIPPPDPHIEGPDLSGFTREESGAAARETGNWQREESEKLFTGCESDGVFFLALKIKEVKSKEDPGALGSGVEIIDSETEKYRSFVHNNQVHSALWSGHLPDFGNPHKVTAKQTEALESVNGARRDDGGNIQLKPADKSKLVIISGDKDDPHSVIFDDPHSRIKADNPHNVQHSELGGVPPGDGDDIRNKHVSTLDIDKWDNASSNGSNHAGDKENPHKVTAEQTGALVSVNGVAYQEVPSKEAGEEPVKGEEKTGSYGNIDLVADESSILEIEPDPGNNRIVFKDKHAGITGNPHGVNHSDLSDILALTAEDADDIKDKHISNNDEKRWDEAVKKAEASLGSEGGILTGTVHINTTEWSALSGNATKTHGVMGRLTEDLETGSDYRCAGLVGVSEIEGKHGVYARSPGDTHALYVEGAAMFTGPKSGYLVDTFKNGSGKSLKTGDLVKLKAAGISRFYGDGEKIPVPEVALADKEGDGAVIGVVDRLTIPEPEDQDKIKSVKDTGSIAAGKELYVVTLGCYAKCKVDAARGAIEVGDLLTSSANPGFAQKAVEPKLGTIIGKALEPLKEGTGHIAVFVNLQ